MWEGNHGTLGGDPEWKSGGECVSGSCLEFDGSNDYVDCGNDSSLSFGNNSFTIEMWANLDNHSDGVNSWGTGAYVMKLYPAIFYLYLEDDDANTQTFGYAVGGTVGQWDHYIAVRDRGTSKVRLYMNGVLKKNTDDNLGSITTNDGDIWDHTFIGRANFGWYEADGLIDEVHIYNSAATITQIQSQYLAGLDKLLSNGAISKQEYNQRIKELSKEIVIE